MRKGEKVLKVCNWVLKNRGVRKFRAETIFEELMDKNFRKLNKGIKKSYQMKQDKHTWKKKINRYIVIKLKKPIKVKILKAREENKI